MARGPSYCFASFPPGGEQGGPFRGLRPPRAPGAGWRGDGPERWEEEEEGGGSIFQTLPTPEGEEEGGGAGSPPSGFFPYKK